jgi:hypothetical protein
MRVPDKEIRVGLMAALASLSYSGQPVPIAADMNAPVTTYPRVTIKSISSTQEGSKSQFMYETDITLLIEDRKINVVNSNIVDDIADAIAQLLVPSIQGEYFYMASFRAWFIDINSTVSNTYTVTPHQYIDKNIRLTLKIEQK